MFKKEVFELVGEEFEVLGEYINYNTKIKMKHNICGHEWEITPNNFIARKSCPICTKDKLRNKFIKKQEEINKEIKEIHGSDYILISDYIDYHSPVYIKHLICNYERKYSSYANFLNSSGCPICNKNISNGEYKILRYLEKHKINYTYQYRDLKCKNKRALPFDFAIKNKDRVNDTVVLFLEYDGEFHFEAGRYSKDKDKMKSNFLNRQKYDKVKNNYCIKNNITLFASHTGNTITSKQS